MALSDRAAGCLSRVFEKIFPAAARRAERAGRQVKRPQKHTAPAGVRRGVTHRLFVSDVVDVRGSWEHRMHGRYEVLSCVAGSARVRTAEGEAELPYTRSLLMPASAGSYVIEGTCRVLRSYATRPGEVA